MSKFILTSLLLTSTLISSCSSFNSTSPAAEPEVNELFSKKSTGNGDTDKNSTKKVDNTDWGNDGKFTHSNKRGTTYHHKHYTLSYSEEDEQAEWVSYELTKSESYGDEERSDLFAEDPIITTGSAHPYEYRNSGYDKGHLAPSADMRFDEEAMNECFYMSNISPQHHAMNKGAWNDLEMQTRKWARYYGRVYVVCGPVLNYPNSKKKKLSYDDKYKGRTTTNITIPDYFYKIIFDFSKKGKEKMLAFCIPNKEIEDSYLNYAVTVDSIETLTGIDFFMNLPTEIQTKYESKIDIKKWK